ncbi:hypothetical protein ACJBQ8_10180, partial [Streptococcus suis]
NYVIPLDKTPSGDYAANFTDADLKGAKKFRIEIIRKIPYGSAKNIVENKSIKLDPRFRR